MVWASAIPPDHRIVLRSVGPTFSTVPATFRLFRDRFFGIQVTDGSIMSADDMKVLAIISKMGSRYTKPTQISTK